MGIRKKITMSRTFLVLLGIFLTTFISGCVGNEVFSSNFGSKVSAAEEINTSVSLINNAESRYDEVRDMFQAGSYSSTKTSLEASKADYEEALNILENSTTDYEEEQQAIDYYKSLSICGLDKAAFLEDAILCTEHFEKAVAYMSSSDFESVRKEMGMAEKSLNDSFVPLKSARTELEKIDPKMVPLEDKSSIIMTKKHLEQSEKMASELGELISGFYPIVDGSEHLINASKLIEDEQWGAAALEVNESSLKFSVSVGTFENLKDSEFPEISVSAIGIYGYLTQMEEPLLHLENGCNYADKGRYTQAINEFNLASNEFSLASGKIRTATYL
jgi:tetratricopeptide (TPR) repeat protein